ncbi:MAG: hypothetical protein AAB554_04350 [Patescibacteria group bacterium]
MIVAIRNMTSLDLHLASSAGERSMRLRVTAAPPVLKEGEQAERLRAGEGHGFVNCSEGLRVQIDVSGSGLTIRVARRKDVVDKIDDDGQLDGEETYLEFILTLMN